MLLLARFFLVETFSFAIRRMIYNNSKAIGDLEILIIISENVEITQ